MNGTQTSPHRRGRIKNVSGTQGGQRAWHASQTRNLWITHTSQREVCEIHRFCWVPPTRPVRPLYGHPYRGEAVPGYLSGPGHIGNRKHPPGNYNGGDRHSHVNHLSYWLTSDLQKSRELCKNRAKPSKSAPDALAIMTRNVPRHRTRPSFN